MAQNQQLTGMIHFRPLARRSRFFLRPLNGSRAENALPVWLLAVGFWLLVQWDHGQAASQSRPVPQCKRRERRERALAGAGGGGAQRKVREDVRTSELQMPSPIGHAIAGIIAGSLVSPPRDHGVRVIAAYAAAGMAADLDLLVGAHSGPSHGIGAALLVGVITWTMLRRMRAERSGIFACAIAMAYTSHTLLDWMGTDSSPPIGIMALWPFSGQYFESPWHVFMAISRRYWLPEFWTVNLLALGRELLILLPVAVIVILIRRSIAEARVATSEERNDGPNAV
jgi:inner membrane protein